MNGIKIYRAGKLGGDYAYIIQKTPDHIFSLPRELYADNPTQLLRAVNNWPTGRSWELGLCFLDGIWVTSQEACNKTNKGYYSFPNMILAEIWADYGDDGHTRMVIIGYATISWNPGERITFRSIRQATQDLEFPKE